MASIRRRRRAKSDVWLVDYRDASGARQRLTAPTKEAAENLLSEKTPDRDITLSEYKDRWLEMIESEVKPRTLASYTQLLDLHIVPAFGRVRLRELSRAMIKRLLLKKREAGLGKNSVRLIRATLSVMLSDAVDDAILLANPALNLGRRQRGRPDKLSVADRVRNIRPMSQAELGTFLAAAQEATALYAPLFLVLAHAGLRPGEAFALQWPDVDFANRRMRIERAWSAGRVETPKTGRGRMGRHERARRPNAASFTREATRAEAEAPLGGYAGVGLLHGGRNAAGRKPRTEELRQGPEEGATGRLPRLRPAAYLRLALAVPGCTDHLRGSSART